MGVQEGQQTLEHVRFVVTLHSELSPVVRRWEAEAEYFAIEGHHRHRHTTWDGYADDDYPYSSNTYFADDVAHLFAVPLQRSGELRRVAWRLWTLHHVSGYSPGQLDVPQRLPGATCHRKPQAPENIAAQSVSPRVADCGTSARRQNGSFLA